MVSEQSERGADPQRWVVFVIISIAYFFVYFHRVSTSVIAPALLESFSTDATSLGFMSSMYFYVYALEQPLVGYLSDRFGPRRIIAFWSAIAAAGSLFFGMAPSVGWATLARGLIGFGVGGVYVPALKAFSQRFPPREFARTTGMFLAMGNLGAIAATAPLVWLSAMIGWRFTFETIGIISFLIAGAALFLMDDYREPFVSPESSTLARPAPSWRKTGAAVLLSLRFWSFGFLLFGAIGTFITLQGLWAASYLMSRFHIGMTRASELNMLIPMGFIVGSSLSGWLGARLFAKKENLLVILLAVIAGAWIIITVPLSFVGIGYVSAAFFIIGVSSGAVATTTWSLVNDTTPRRIMGLMSGFLNPFPLLGMAILQSLTGTILDYIGPVGDMYPPEAFRSAFSLCFAVSVLCLAIAISLRTTVKHSSN